MKEKRDQLIKDQMGESIQRKPVVLARVGLSDPAVWRLERDGLFPKRFKLGGNSVGWLKSEIDAWIELRANDRLKLPSVAEKAQLAQQG